MGNVQCAGHRDRCVEEAQTFAYTEWGLPANGERVSRARVYNPECPTDCTGECVKSYKRRKCIYLGQEPPDGFEGHSIPRSPMEKLPQDYRVIDIGATKEELEGKDPDLR